MLRIQWLLAVSVCMGLLAASSSYAQDRTSDAPAKKVAAGSEKDIVDTAVAAKKFNTLAAALKAAGLVETLKGEGPYTVFAPTDEAFSKLPDGTVENLLRPENKDKLTNILKHHVVSGKVMAADVMKMKNAKPLAGNALKINAEEGKVMVGKATVTSADIKCSNGVIHVIDTVLLPMEPKSKTSSP